MSVTMGSDETACDVTGLEQCSDYTVAVLAVNGYGDGVESVPAKGTTTSNGRQEGR